MMRLRFVAVCAFAVVTLAACRSQEKFPPIGDRIASPIDVAVSDDGQRFYVLNADFDRTYDMGSILILSKNGEKLGTTEIPRMGRRLVVSGTDMLLATDYGDGNKSPPKLFLFDITDASRPVEKAQLELDCSPFNIVARKGYQHFAVTCIDGQILIGTLTPDRSVSTLKRVRGYGASYRALYLDAKRELLLGFVADPSQKKLSDTEYQDATRYDANAQEIKGPGGELLPNDIPDIMEDRVRAQANRLQRIPYQYFVFDIAKERTNAPGCIKTEQETCEFPLRPGSDPEVVKELRWTYFKLAGLDGAPDPSEFSGDPTYKYYRSNFWEAKPDPSQDDVFYLSQRAASEKAPYSNNILKVTIRGDLRPKDKDLPLTKDVLGFERVYGFKNSPEDNPKHFPSDFVVTNIDGQSTLIVNHVKDLSIWPKSDQFFSLAAKTLSGQAAGWSKEVEGSLSKNNVVTFFQVAATADGRVASCSFYGNSVILLQLNPGVGFEEVARVQ